VGAELIRRNALTREEVTLQSIRAWLSEHPEEARPLLYTNPSYIFFRVLDEGPLGNIQVPLTEGRSLAVDEHLFPKGGLAYVETELPDPADPSRSVPLRRFFLIQDTGGAIRGHGRADLFWGRGGQAEWKAGHLKHPGRLFILVARKEALAAASAAAD
jgi:membrane-bound lytic murein transglycosylase A